MAEPEVTPERLDELRDVLAKIPGADRKPWTLEIYDQDDAGQEVLIKAIDIRSGRAVSRRKRKRSKMDNTQDDK